MQPARVTPELLAELERLVPFAPLHEPHNLAPIKMAMQLAPDLPQVACFDTAFHRTAPEVEQAFALPYSLYEEGVRRYGFHGLSYEYIASVLPQRAPEIAEGRVVVAHLGNGCSACAMRNGVSVATTMGFTALDGLPMGTRCGELDPGVVLHLIQQKEMSPDALVDLLYRRSGMLGLSGISSDFRELLASDDPRARFAVDVFCYRVARHIGSLAAALGGLDGIVFTAGVGENAAPVRTAVCHACAWLGLELDEAANREHRERISTPASRVATYVINTDENLMIARHARAPVTLRNIRGRQDHVRKSQHRTQPPAGIFSAADLKRRIAELEAAKRQKNYANCRRRKNSKRLSWPSFTGRPRGPPDNCCRWLFSSSAEPPNAGRARYKSTAFRTPCAPTAAGGSTIESGWEQTLEGRPSSVTILARALTAAGLWAQGRRARISRRHARRHRLFSDLEVDLY